MYKSSPTKNLHKFTLIQIYCYWIALILAQDPSPYDISGFYLTTCDCTTDVACDFFDEEYFVDSNNFSPGKITFDTFTNYWKENLTGILYEDDSLFLESYFAGEAVGQSGLWWNKLNRTINLLFVNNPKIMKSMCQVSFRCHYGNCLRDE